MMDRGFPFKKRGGLCIVREGNSKREGRYYDCQN
jgi:hypothetical protein